MTDQEPIITGTLEDWAVVTDDPYSPPEVAWQQLQGRVYGHEKRPDGQQIITSLMNKVEWRLVTTSSGSVYKLGTPAKEYMEYCKSEGCHVPTEEEPIKLTFISDKTR